MSDLVHANNSADVEAVLERLRRPDIDRDSVSLLMIKLIELRYPERKAEFVSDSEIKLTWPDGKTGSVYLQNIWIECEQTPDERAHIVDRFVRILAGEPETASSRSVSVANVVVLVRDEVYRS